MSTCPLRRFCVPYRRPTALGITNDLDRRLSQLKPDELINSIECINYKEIEKELHDTFKDFRIPQTEYFRLDETQVEMAIKLMFELEKF